MDACYWDEPNPPICIFIRLPLKFSTCFVLLQRVSPFGTQQFPDHAEFPCGSPNVCPPRRDVARTVPRDAVGTPRPSPAAPGALCPSSQGCWLGPAKQTGTCQEEEFTCLKQESHHQCWTRIQFSIWNSVYMLISGWFKDTYKMRIKHDTLPRCCKQTNPF